MLAAEFWMFGLYWGPVNLYVPSVLLVEIEPGGVCESLILMTLK
jgi:hypothetical protein